MYKSFHCPKCNRPFTTRLPDVTPAEAQALREADNDKGVFIQCPNCNEEIWLRQAEIPTLPDAPP